MADCISELRLRGKFAQGGLFEARSAKDVAPGFSSSFLSSRALAILAGALTLGVCLHAQDSDSTRVTQVRFWSLGDVTRVAIEVSSEFKYKSGRLSDPPRVFFDIQGARPDGVKGMQTIPVNDGIIHQIRVAETQPGVTRVVLDLKDPLEFMASQLSNPARLMLELRSKEKPIPPAVSSSGGRSLAPAGSPPAAAPDPSPNTPPATSPNVKTARFETSATSGFELPIGAYSNLPKVAESPAPPKPKKPQPRKFNPPPTAEASGPPKPAPGPIELAAPPPVQFAMVLPTSRPLRGFGTVIPKLPAPPFSPPAETLAAAATAAPPKPVEPVRVVERAPALDAAPSRTPSKVAREAKKPQVDLGAAPIPAKTTTNGGQSLTRALGLKLGRIVLDPGHGGNDVGTHGPSGVLEKDLVLDVAKRLGRMLESRLNSEVIYTREEDQYVGLEDRTRIANEHRADLFLSIHVNSSPFKTVGGVETYYLNLTNTKAALEVAARENATSERSIFELKDILTKIAQQDKVQESREFASRVQNSLFSLAAKGNTAVKNRGVKKAPFIVLIGAEMPSVLAEIGFLTNSADEALLRKSDHREKIADALYKGIASYAETLSRSAVVAQRK